jgi:hypothetical protein
LDFRFWIFDYRRTPDTDWILTCHSYSDNPKFLSSFPIRRPFFDEGARSLFGVFGLHNHALEIGLISEALFESHLAAFIDRFFYVAQRERRAL